MGLLKFDFNKANAQIQELEEIASEIDQLADDIGIIANGKMRYQGALSNLHETDKNKSLEQIFLDLTGKDMSL